jgi:hypothetical protein
LPGFGRLNQRMPRPVWHGVRLNGTSGVAPFQNPH